MVSSCFPTVAVSQRWKGVGCALLALSVAGSSAGPSILLQFMCHRSYSAARPVCNSLCLICIQSLLQGSYFATEQKIKMVFTGLTVCPKSPFQNNVISMYLNGRSRVCVPGALTDLNFGKQNQRQNIVISSTVTISGEFLFTGTVEDQIDSAQQPFGLEVTAITGL